MKTIILVSLLMAENLHASLFPFIENWTHFCTIEMTKHTPRDIESFTEDHFLIDPKVDKINSISEQAFLETEITNLEITLFPSAVPMYYRVIAEVPIISILVYNTSSQIQYKTSQRSNENSIEILVENWPAGIYWVHVYTSEGMATRQMVVQP